MKLSLVYIYHAKTDNIGMLIFGRITNQYLRFLLPHLQFYTQNLMDLNQQNFTVLETLKIIRNTRTFEYSLIRIKSL